MSNQLLDELTTVVLAPNPSPMTLDGTNTYVLAAPGAGEVVVVDPGPALPAHFAAVQQAIAERTVAAVVLTHHHADHAEAAGWAQKWQAALYAFNPAMVPVDGVEALPDGRVLHRAGVGLEAVHTPGHCSDHLCLRVRDSDVVLSGDHILGRGTTVVAWPDGDMRAYFASLERVAALGAQALYPGHGPALRDPAAVVAEYAAHRRERERQVLDALRAGADGPAAVVRRIYRDVDPALHGAAERSVRAHLDKLVADRHVRVIDGRWTLS